ncbi:MAG: Wzz/FepE/Etk N-terminal domain-containing protein [Bacteroidales bacterium]|nr:Wzz/FepE/Etk N-terminal domain-containing protein [Bacteroidales bacterium]
MDNNMNMPQSPVTQQDDLNIKDIIDCCWRVRWWMAGAAILSLILAFCYVRSQTPTYQRSTWIMLNKPDGTNADLSLLAEFTGKTVTKKIDNEIFILKSPTLLSKVVTDLGLNTRYYHYAMPIADRLRVGRFLMATKLVEYYMNNPVEMSVEQNGLYPDAMHPTSIYVKFKNIDGEKFVIRKFLVNGQSFKAAAKTYSYGESIIMDAFNLVISKTAIDDLIDGDSYVCTWNTPMATANAFESKLTATANGKGAAQTDVVTLSIVDALPRGAEDILNALVLMTNAESREYKGLSMHSTMDFIDQRLAAISSDLGAAEQNYKNYQANRVVVNLESQSQLELTSDMQYKTQLTEVRMQIQILNMVSGIMKESGPGDYRVIPANIGISDTGLHTIIANYNSLVAERNMMVAKSSETNPRGRSMN